MTAPARPRPTTRPRPPSANRPPVRRRPHPSAARALGSVLAGAATCGALLALDPVVAPGGWTTAGVLAVAAAAALLAALRAVWGNRIGPTLVTAAAGAATLVNHEGSRLAGDPSAPGTDALAHVATRLDEAFRQINEGVAPLVAGHEVTLLIQIGALAVLLLLDLSVALGVPVLGGLALVALWVPAVALGAPASGWALVWAGLPWLALVAGVPTMTGRRARLEATGWSAAVLVLALGVTPLMSAAPGWGTVPLPRLGSGSGSVSLSDDLDLRRDLQARSDQTVLTYTLAAADGSPSPLSVTDLGPLRSFTLTGFNGRSWSVDDAGDDALTSWEPGQLLSPQDQDTPRSAGSQVQVAVTVDGLADRYLPVTLAPREVAVAGSWRYDPMRDLVLGSEPTRAGTAYRMLAHVPAETAANLTRQTSQNPSDRTALAMPGSAHDGDVAALAARVTDGRSTTYDKALALQTFLRTSAGFVYDEQIPPAASDDAVWDFLQDKRGYCVQFATAMVVMARSLGLPARLAVGFLPGTDQDGTVTVTGRQAHAWPEIWFDESGWVRFEPTPAVQTGAPPPWTVAISAGTASPVAEDEPTVAANRPTASTSAAPMATAAGASTPGGSGRWWWLAGAGAVLVGLGTWVVRHRTHRRTLDPEGAWAAMRRSLAGAGLTWTDATTPRQAARAVRRSATLDAATLDAIEELAAELERSRYVAGGATASPEQLDQWVQRIDGALRTSAAGRGRRRRRPDENAEHRG
ncbi:MAG: DUF3488 and transglutaminase-like domain-containing protein [Actinobacteria bacterium]|nr:DUF3488 and transglutaminase-like domain-containing protein [Actinomycetota bacterium]